MNFIQVLILGVVQGITEFIPVSSSAHLVLIPDFLGWGIPPVSFDIAVHIGTLFAVLLYLRRDIFELFGSGRKLLPVILVACIPTAALGFFLKDFFESLFENSLGVSCLLLVTGFVLWLPFLRITGHVSDSDTGGQRATSDPNAASGLGQVHKISYIDALWIGFAQGCAIAPGISRSGSTISAGLLRGLSKDSALRFAFLLFIPAMLGALLLKLKDFSSAASSGLPPWQYFAGGAVSFISGYFAINMVFASLKKGRWKIFSYYCWILGVFGIFLALSRG